MESPSPMHNRGNGHLKEIMKANYHDDIGHAASEVDANNTDSFFRRHQPPQVSERNLNLMNKTEISSTSKLNICNIDPIEVL